MFEEEQAINALYKKRSRSTIEVSFQDYLLSLLKTHEDILLEFKCYGYSWMNPFYTKLNFFKDLMHKLLL